LKYQHIKVLDFKKHGKITYNKKKCIL